MSKLWTGLIILALLAGACLWWTMRPAPPRWTTSSPEAAAELDSAIEAASKYYWQEAEGHLERALELDPEFVAAKLIRLERFGGPDRETVMAELAEVDRERLTERERFLLDYRLAREAGRSEDADTLISDYLAEHPGDPWALNSCSSQAWLDQDWERAERHYRQLLEADPNWVEARNRLGYIAMAQGRFDEAEEQFRAYRFVAPDQPNPHDSMGELLTLRGRYDEARTELAKALEIKPDFCHAYRSLIEIEILTGLEGDLDDLLGRVEEHCPGRFADFIRCEAAVWSSFFEGRWEEPLAEENAECREVLGPFDSTLHRMASLAGRFDEARAAEDALRTKIDELEGYPIESKGLRALLLHMTGVRLTAEGDLEEAARFLEKADGLILYFGDGFGILKLYNRMQLAYALERLGEVEKSRAILATVEEVNPEFAAVYPWIRDTFAG